MTDDFTEERYREILRITKNRWMFGDYSQYRSNSKLCIWRHDIDFSIHRARRLAEIETEEGVKSTFFVDLHSFFYNALEGESIRLIEEIVGLGHSIGLHFDGTAYYGIDFSKTSLAKKITTEAKILNHFYHTPISAVSFHNPDQWNALEFDDDRIAGLINAYGKTIRKKFEYVSDSNGYWKYKNLLDVVQAGTAERLHVLTHDAWWQSTSMSSNDRIRCCIKGRGEKTWNQYKKILHESGRNIED